MLLWEKASNSRSRLLSSASGRAPPFTGSQRDVNKAIKLGKSVSQQKPQNEPKEALTRLKITFMA